MPLTRVRASQRGFSLLEAVVASFVLSVTCIGISSVVASSLHAQSATGARQRLTDALVVEVELLDALPFASSQAAAGLPETPDQPSLVGEVFPHARTEENRPDAYYVPPGTGADAGAFVTVSRAADRVIRCVARFVTADGAGWRVAVPSSLDAWSRSGAGLPSEALQVELTASAGRGRQVVRVVSSIVITAVRPAVAMSPGSGS